MCEKIKFIKSRLFLFCAILSSFLFLSCIFNIKTSLNPPLDIQVSKITSNSAVVTWSSVKHAGSYEVMWTTKGNVSWNYIIVYETGTKLEDLSFDQDYTVQVCANPSDSAVFYGPSEYNGIDFKTLMDDTPEGELARPTNITASFNEDNSALKVTWGAVEGASYYDLDFEFSYPYSPETIKILKTVPASQTEFTYTGTMYTNVVSLKIAARNSDFSDTCRWSKELIVTQN